MAEVNCTLVLPRGSAERQRLCLLAITITSPRLRERVAQVDGGRRTPTPSRAPTKALTMRLPRRAKVLLRWCVQREIPVIPKSTHRKRIEENA